MEGRTPSSLAWNDEIGDNESGAQILKGQNTQRFLVVKINCLKKYHSRKKSSNPFSHYNVPVRYIQDFQVF